MCAHTHTHILTQHTVVHKMHTVVYYTLVCTTHNGTLQLQQYTIHTVVHDTRTFGLAEDYPLIYLICLVLSISMIEG